MHVVLIAVVAAVLALVSAALLAAAWRGGPRVAWRPRAKELRGFLTPRECAVVKKLALRHGIGRSEVVGEEDPHPSRTSSGAFLKRDCHPVVEKIYARAADILGVPESHMEDLQVLRYEEGQEYLAHHDSCFDGCDGGKDIDRYATFIIYLNEGFEGGETEFPQQGIAVAPETGKAALFFNLDRGGTRVLPESLHRAVPPLEGTKWSAALWVRRTPWTG